MGYYLPDGVTQDDIDRYLEGDGRPEPEEEEEDIEYCVSCGAYPSQECEEDCPSRRTAAQLPPELDPFYIERFLVNLNTIAQWSAEGVEHHG